MLYVDEKDHSIKLTRGDTARFNVDIVSSISGENYAIQSEDTLTMTVKKSVKDDVFCFQKTVTGSTSLHVEPNDTKTLPFGKYVYDVQLNTANGDVYTIIEPASFEVLKEVT